jgi:hypothetical protein
MGIYLSPNSEPGEYQSSSRVIPEWSQATERSVYIVFISVSCPLLSFTQEYDNLPLWAFRRTGYRLYLATTVMSGIKASYH